MCLWPLGKVMWKACKKPEWVHLNLQKNIKTELEQFLSLWTPGRLCTARFFQNWLQSGLFWEVASVKVELFRKMLFLCVQIACSMILFKKQSGGKIWREYLMLKLWKANLYQLQSKKLKCTWTVTQGKINFPFKLIFLLVKQSLQFQLSFILLLYLFRAGIRQGSYKWYEFRKFRQTFL